MWCLGCRRPIGGRRRVCATCAAGMRPAPDRVVESTLVRSAYLHDGAARVLVHRLKYHGIRAAGDVLAEAMVALVPSGVRCLAPIPRSWARRAALGVDPPVVLARRIGLLAGLPVIDCLCTPLVSVHHAGRRRRERAAPPFTRASAVTGAAIIDDVVTTGATVAAAVRALGSGAVTCVITATAAQLM